MRRRKSWALAILTVLVVCFSLRLRHDETGSFSSICEPVDEACAGRQWDISDVRMAFDNVVVEADIRSTEDGGFRYMAEPVVFDKETCQSVLLGNPHELHALEEEGHYAGDHGEELWLSEGCLLFDRGDEAKTIREVFEFAEIYDWYGDAKDNEPQEDEAASLLGEKSKKMAYALGIPLCCDIVSAKRIDSDHFEKVRKIVEMTTVKPEEERTVFYQIDLTVSAGGVPILSRYSSATGEYVGNLVEEPVLIRFLYKDQELMACEMMGCATPTMVENQTYDLTTEAALDALHEYFSEIIFEGMLNIQTIYPSYHMRFEFSYDQLLWEPLWCYEGELIYPDEQREKILVLLTTERRAA